MQHVAGNGTGGDAHVPDVRDALDLGPVGRQLGDALNYVDRAFDGVHGEDPPAEFVERLQSHGRPDAANDLAVVHGALMEGEFFLALSGLILADFLYQAFGNESAAKIVVHQQNGRSRPMCRRRLKRLWNIGQAGRSRPVCREAFGRLLIPHRLPRLVRPG